HDALPILHCDNRIGNRWRKVEGIGRVDDIEAFRKLSPQSSINSLDDRRTNWTEGERVWEWIAPLEELGLALFEIVFYRVTFSVGCEHRIAVVGETSGQVRGKVSGI